jgi:hypothetical protein
MPFVRHFMKRDDDLPIVVAIATAPIIMPNGEILAPDGLDRERGIIFEIQKELRAFIPKSGLHREGGKGSNSIPL